MPQFSFKSQVSRAQEFLTCHLPPVTYHSKKGFTLIELMVVIAILAILAVTGMAILTRVQKQARDGKRKADIESISKAYESNYQNGYSALLDSNFVDNNIPKDPGSKGDSSKNYYNVRAVDGSAYKVCAALEDNSSNLCTSSATNCFCKGAAQGKFSPGVAITGVGINLGMGYTGAAPACDLDGNLVSGLAGYWKMDESSANTCTGGVNDSCDSSGNGNNAAWNGNTTNTTGKFGNGVIFDGSGDFINAGSPSSLDNLRGNGMTYTAWINPNFSACTTSVFYHNILDKSTGGASLYIYCDAGSNFRLWFINDTTSTDADYRAIIPISNGSWSHVAAVYNGNPKTAKLYINGSEVSSYSTAIPGTGSETNDASSNFHIGAQLGNSQYFRGNIDEVRVYNRALSSSEISYLYSSGGGCVQ